MQARCMRLLARQSSSVAFEVRNVSGEARELAESLAERLASNHEACSSFVARLDQPTKAKIIRALVASEGGDGQQISKTYLDNLFKEHDKRQPYEQLDRC